MTNLEIVEFIKARPLLTSKEVAVQLHKQHPGHTLTEAVDLVNTVRENLP